MISDRALSRWYDSLPSGPSTCSDCGRVDSKFYVQPQHPDYADGKEGVARCAPCLNERIRAARERRKAALAAESRCSAPSGCRRRGTYYVGTDRVLLCGAHLRAAQSGIRRSGLAHLDLFQPLPSGRDAVFAALENAARRSAR